MVLINVDFGMKKFAFINTEMTLLHCKEADIYKNEIEYLWRNPDVDQNTIVNYSSLIYSQSLQDMGC